MDRHCHYEVEYKYGFRLFGEGCIDRFVEVENAKKWLVKEQ